jgi:hypothetical protein
VSKAPPLYGRSVHEVAGRSIKSGNSSPIRRA